MHQGNRDLYIEVLLPLPLDNPVYGYLADEAVEKGQLCEVPFGNGKGVLYVGLVVSVSKEKPKKNGNPITLKRVLRILPFPPIQSPVLKTWEWCANYALCSSGEVLRAALPSGIEKYTGKGLSKRVWRFNLLFFSDPSFQNEILRSLNRKKSALAFLERLISGETEVGVKAESLNEFREKTGLSVHTLGVLKDVGVVEAQDEAEEDIAFFPTRAESSSEDDFLDGWNGKSVLLSYHLASRLEERVPVSFLVSSLSRSGGNHLLLFPNLESLKVAEPMLREAFGSLLFPYYHASNGGKIKERTWTAALKGKAGIYYGLRSAVWLPFGDLKSVVIVDEEDHGYRQFEPAPRFTASYLAIMLAKAFRARTLLSTASPSVETAFRTFVSKKYAYQKLPASKGLEMGKMTLVDMEQVFQLGEVYARMLSPTMMQAVTACLDAGGKVLLYYQRQGFARYVSCGNCHEVLKCPVCTTTLRYYGRGKHNLVCPACGHVEPRPNVCPHCGEPKLSPVGTGIERLYEAIRSHFIGSEVRLLEDAETLSPGISLSTGYEPSLGALKEADMVGVVQWDLLELRPDFRAVERSYRYMSKVLSETRRETPVVVQFFRPYGQGMKSILANRYRFLLDYELESRFAVGFSPFSRQIDVVVQSGRAEDAFATASSLVSALASFSEVRILGPSPLSPSRQKAEIGYRMTLLLPLENSSSDVRRFLKEWRLSVLKKHRGSPLFIYFDVDPQ